MQSGLVGPTYEVAGALSSVVEHCPIQEPSGPRVFGTVTQHNQHTLAYAVMDFTRGCDNTTAQQCTIVVVDQHSLTPNTVINYTLDVLG